MTPSQDPRDLLFKESAIELVNGLLRRAYEISASDLHLIPTDDGLEVLFRCDGELSRLGVIPGKSAATVIGRFKVLADLLVYRSDIPQEGRIPREQCGIESEVRIATYPALLGEKIAVRLDARRGVALELDGIGLSPENRDALAEALAQPEGVILMTGPSGSGKTTTLYSCLNHLVAQPRRRNIVTVEDPVERRIEGVVQTEVNESAGVTYGAALRSILRQDPEVILIGEIRDRATASTALEAGLTGHLIASTVHAGTAPQVFARLMEMGIEPFAMTSVIRGVLSQRLVRRTCAAEPMNHTECSTCGGTGYQGRVLVSEWVAMSDPLRKAVLSRSDCDGLTRAAALSGYRSLHVEGRSLVERGITTQQEVDRVLGRDLHQITGGDAQCVGGFDPLPPDVGGDVPGECALASSAAPVIPRPQPGAAGRRVGAHGPGLGSREEPDGGVREPAGPAAGAVPCADSGRDR